MAGELRRLWPAADVVEDGAGLAPALDPGDDRFRALADSSSLLERRSRAGAVPVVR